MWGTYQGDLKVQRLVCRALRRRSGNKRVKVGLDERLDGRLVRGRRLSNLGTLVTEDSRVEAIVEGQLLLRDETGRVGEGTDPYRECQQRGSACHKKVCDVQ